MKAILLVFTCSLFFGNYIVGQQHVNKVWKKETGNPIGLDWSQSILNESSELIHVGNKNAGNEGANILLTKHDSDGNLIWNVEYNSIGQNNDYGITVKEDNQGNVYVLGTTDNNSTTNYDLTLMKVSASGSLTWSTTYGSPFQKNDFGTSLVIDPITNNIYVVGSSEGNSTEYDFLILSFNANGSILWENRYDYNSLTEIPIGIEFDASGNLFITGTSASGLQSWDYTLVNYDMNGNYLNEVRHNANGLGFDEVTAYTKDNNGNVYITGKTATNPSNVNIKTIKLNAQFEVQWLNIYDFDGKDDVATSISVDQSGNILIAGYITLANSETEALVLKYDIQGNEVWTHRHKGEVAQQNAKARAVKAGANGAVLLLGEEGNQNNKKTTVTKLKPTGEVEWQEKSKIGNSKPESINIAQDLAVYVTSIEDETNTNEFKYTSTKFKTFTLNQNVIFDSLGKPKYKANELIVRFKRDAINTEIIDQTTDRRIEFGNLSEFLTPQAFESFKRAIDNTCKECEVTAVKIFKQLKTTHTHTVNRLGESIKIPDFWTSLLLVFPENASLEDLYNDLSQATDIIAYTEPNFIAAVANEPNDPLFFEQISLSPIYNTIGFENDINMLEAWEIFPEAGKPFVKCGVLDEGIDFRHEDFGYDGVNISSSKVAGGWSFQNNAPLFSLANPDDVHGTPCAGIIGALRNNNLGIAGIAGGNVDSDASQTGCSLYGMRILNGDASNSFFSNSLNYIYDAVVMSAIDNDSLDYAYGLHISSNSWGIDESSIFGWEPNNVRLLSEAYHFANRASVVNVAARGNNGNIADFFPATFNENWMLNVGGTGSLGDYKAGIQYFGDDNFSPNYGKGIDIGAPAEKNLIKSTANGNIYSSFGRTSAATPHVSGVVALLMGYLNDSISLYQNLAPEDCEQILELSATAVYSGYTDLIGWGRLNAGKALRLVEKPWNTVHHFGTNALSTYSKASSLVSQNELITLTEHFQNEDGQWFNPGQYRVDQYAITANVSHTLNTNDSIIAAWTRPSSSTVLQAIINDSITPHEAVEIISLNDTEAILKGYVYKVYNASGDSLGWWPFDTLLNNSNFEYTILARDRNAPNLSLNNITSNKSNISLFPNPASNNQNLVVVSESNEKAVIDLLDIQGRTIQNVFQGTIDKELSIEINISTLSKGIYMYRVNLGSNTTVLRFIKN